MKHRTRKNARNQTP